MNYWSRVFIFPITTPISIIQSRDYDRRWRAHMLIMELKRTTAQVYIIPSYQLISTNLKKYKSDVAMKLELDGQTVHCLTSDLASRTK